MRCIGSTQPGVRVAPDVRQTNPRGILMTTMIIDDRRVVRTAQNDWLVIFASSLGTVFEWYDFYIYGTLGAILASKFFSGVAPTSAFIFTLLAFAAGFAVRPFGALVFGRLGDLVGRKYTFLVTMTLMGFGTFLIGVLPTYASIGIAAPILLRSEEHTSELQSHSDLVCRLLLEKKKRKKIDNNIHH